MFHCHGDSCCGHETWVCGSVASVVMNEATLEGRLAVTLTIPVENL